MDVDEEVILNTVYNNQIPEQWKDNPDIGLYLAELSSFGVERLSKEPARLAEEKEAILEQTQDLAFRNYRTFIQTADCSKTILKDFKHVEDNLASLLDDLDSFEEKCHSFIKQAADINQRRKDNGSVLACHQQLMEILELPQLMTTCVQNGYYDEALDLISHVRRLERKHVGIPVITNIANEVQESRKTMLQQLLKQLRTNIQLPACLKAIGYLRRIEAFNETELRIKYLQSRDAWFCGILNNIPNEDPYHHIMKTIEVSRIHLFDIVTQYRAIFSEDDPVLSSLRDPYQNEAAIFHGWISRRVSEFLATLKRDLDRGVGGRIDSVLGQCMYFGLSFGRVGSDFRGLLVPIFQSVALNEFEKSLQTALKKFEENMQSYTLLATTPGLLSSVLATSSSGQNQLSPPINLLQFPPLAHFCNACLGALNDLRAFAPVGIALEVARCMQASLQRVCDVISDYYKKTDLVEEGAEDGMFSAKEMETFYKFCACFLESLVPHMERCLQLLYSPEIMSHVLHMSPIDYNKTGHLVRVDVDKMIERLPAVVKPSTTQLATKAPVLETATNDQVTAEIPVKVDENPVKGMDENPVKTEEIGEETAKINENPVKEVTDKTVASETDLLSANRGQPEQLETTKNDDVISERENVEVKED